MAPSDVRPMVYRGDGSVPTPGPGIDSRAEQGAYLADADLVDAVNTAIAVEQPLLVTGEPGTGKTMLAWSVAAELGLPVLPFYTRSDHRARDVLFVVDNLSRLYDSQAGDPKAKDLVRYFEWHALGRAIMSDAPSIVLIDEIDKAPRDFPNDLLNVIDKMEFTIPEIRQEPFRAKHRPIVIITSNSERQLPDPFLRRCVFHYIEFPTPARLLGILKERVGPGIDEQLATRAIERFETLRGKELGLEKKPSTAELIVWVKMLIRGGVPPEKLGRIPLNELPYRGAIIKNESDLRRLQVR